MKKILCFISTLVCIMTVFCGCDSLNKQPVTLADSISIPENGIVESSVIEELKTENKAVTFKGQSGDIHYEWVIFGSDIPEVKALNLGIEVTAATSEHMAFRFLSEENFGFSPVLSIYLKDIWEVQSASAGDGAGITQEVTVTVDKKQTILNFSPKVQTGAYVITPNTERNPTLSSTPIGGSSSETSSYENSDTTQSSEPPSIVPSENPETSNIPEPSQNTTHPDTQPSSTEGQQATVSEPPTDSERPVSDGKNTEQDKYKTDPVPEDKPLPVEPDNQEVDDKKTYTCTLSIECTAIFNHLSDLDPEKLDILPKNGILFATQTVTFYEGESVYDVLQRVCRENRIPMEASFTPMYNSAYVEGIGNLYEFDCGSGSGWMYRVDGWYPNYGCSRYQLKQGEKIEWRYTCDLGKDVGGGYAVDE